jgi:hypothetical protein
MKRPPSRNSVDAHPRSTNNKDMSTGFVEIDKDLSEVVRLVSAKTKDTEALRDARERADRVREEMKAKYGKLNVAVELVQETRDSK